MECLEEVKVKLTNVVRRFLPANVVGMNNYFVNENFDDSVVSDHFVSIHDIRKFVHAEKNLQLRGFDEVVLIIADAVSGQKQKVLGDDGSAAYNSAVLHQPDHVRRCA